MISLLKFGRNLTYIVQLAPILYQSTITLALLSGDKHVKMKHGCSSCEV